MSHDTQLISSRFVNQSVTPHIRYRKAFLAVRHELFGMAYRNVLRRTEVCHDTLVRLRQVPLKCVTPQTKETREAYCAHRQTHMNES